MDIKLTAHCIVKCKCGNSLDLRQEHRNGFEVVRVTPCKLCIDAAVKDAVKAAVDRERRNKIH